jgi:hypothetical protein
MRGGEKDYSQRLSHSLISFVGIELKVLRGEEGSDVAQTLLVETTQATSRERGHGHNVLLSRMSFFRVHATRYDVDPV